MNEVLRSKKD